MAVNTAPAYGTTIRIENSANLYLRDKALDAVHEQIVDDLSHALFKLRGRDVVMESDPTAISGLIGDLSDALELARAAWEMAEAKLPTEGD